MTEEEGPDPSECTYVFCTFDSEEVMCLGGAPDEVGLLRIIQAHLALYGKGHKDHLWICDATGRAMVSPERIGAMLQPQKWPEMDVFAAERNESRAQAVAYALGREEWYGMKRRVEEARDALRVLGSPGGGRVSA